MNLQFQLVLQFDCNAIEDFDALIDLEDRLTDLLEVDGLHLVDGHDSGSGEMNIFILTDTPEAAFSIGLETLQAAELKGMKAAYRPVAGEEYTLMWPKGSTTPFTII